MVLLWYQLMRELEPTSRQRQRSLVFAQALASYPVFAKDKSCFNPYPLGTCFLCSTLKKGTRYPKETAKEHVEYFQGDKSSLASRIPLLLPHPKFGSFLADQILGSVSIRSYETDDDAVYHYLSPPHPPKFCCLSWTFFPPSRGKK